MNQISFTELDDWADIHRLRSGPPPRDLNSLFSWIHAIHVTGPYEAAITAGFDRVMRHHTGGNECWLGISGQSHLGKSQAVTHILLERAMADPAAWRTRSRSGGRFTPYVYVEMGSALEARGVLSAIAKAVGLPHEGSEKELHQMLAVILVELGTLLIVIDEAQMLRRRSDNASRVTDGVRVLLHLPVPFAFVGINLEASALLYRSTRNNDTAMQLQRRHMPVTLEPLDNRARKAALTLVKDLKDQVMRVPDLDLRAGLNDPHVLARFVDACEGRPGSLLNVLKVAVIESIVVNEGVLTPELLISEADYQRQTRVTGED